MYKNRDVINCSLGAGCGAIICPLVSKFYPGTVQIPGLEAIAPFNQNDIFYPMVIGGLSLGAGFLIDHREGSPFLIGLGLTSLVSGAIKGVFALPSAGLRRRPARPAIRPRMRINTGLAPRATQVGAILKGRPEKTAAMSETSYSTREIVA